MPTKRISDLFSLSHISAGFVAVLVGYTSSVVIILQAARSAGASDTQIGSWLWALGLGMAVTSIGLSLRYKTPLLTAWSTPGAALLVTGLMGHSLNEAVGIFMFASALAMLAGLSGGFDRLIRHVPSALAGAMLAGVLFQFGLDLFVALEDSTWLVGTMLVTYLLARCYLPRYVIPLTLVAGLSCVAVQGQLVVDELELALAWPVWVKPEFSVAALIGVGLPLFIVTQTSQNLPGLAVLRANGYETPVSPVITTTGLTGLLLAPFGGYAFNLAAITAAICMGENADPDPKRRYRAAVWAGCFYLLTGLFGATVVALFAALPGALVMSIAGLALLATIGNSLAAALESGESRESALITFLVTASGISLMGVGSAFWGLVIGLVAHWLPKILASRSV
ncbi:benzoate/H(+) symporter BenE family transporter [Marinobacterium litorale]|uniref:benzoate/H(+) symporter BenE family transporter n=1 Tax=Marinobacterium litorale TaxID=404770 RepID=UPI0004276671|nr:benzoate/H(+) symporter BenE family transporter [Marinobacterium litorale]